jgi:hypothetical protein
MRANMTIVAFVEAPTILVESHDRTELSQMDKKIEELLDEKG